MSTTSGAPTLPTDPRSLQVWVAPKAKPKPVPSWKWSLARSNASPVILADHEEFDWKSTPLLEFGAPNFTIADTSRDLYAQFINFSASNRFSRWLEWRYGKS